MSDAAAAFVARAVPILARDPRILGVLLAGSSIRGETDRWSDLDLLVVVEAGDEPAVAERERIAASLGTLLACFTGEHVGEPRLLICLFDAPLLHVDLKFAPLDALDRPVETPRLLWDRDGTVAARLAAGSAAWPNRSADWFEARFWTWLHYGVAKLARGELYEVIDLLGFLRATVLGPMAARRAGADQRGVRRIEHVAPVEAEALKATVATHDRASCARALTAATAIYRALRADCPPGAPSAAEQPVAAWLDAVAGERGDG